MSVDFVSMEWAGADPEIQITTGIYWFFANFGTELTKFFNEWGTDPGNSKIDPPLIEYKHNAPFKIQRDDFLKIQIILDKIIFNVHT